jgi:stage V sporulation protein B
MTLSRSISLNFISQIVNLFTSFIISVLLARVLGPEGRGDYILVLTSAGFLVQFFTFGIESSITHFVASGRIQLSKLLYSIFVFICFLGILILVGTILISFYTSGIFIPSQNVNYYIILVFLVLFTFLENVFISILNGIKAFRAVILVSMSLNILVLIAALVFFVFYQGGKELVIPLLYATTAIHLLITLTYIWCYTRFSTAKPGNELLKKGEMKLFFTYSLISFVGSVLQYLNYKMDFWVINYYWGSSSLGIYSLAATLSQLLWILPQSVATIMFPMSSYYNRSELPIISEKLLRISIFITLLIVIPLAVLAPFFIPLLFGKEFVAAAFYFQLFLIGVFPFIIIKILASVFAGTGKVRYNLVASILGFVTGATAYLILIPSMGLTGGVIGSIISYIMATAVGIYFYKKEFPASFYNMLIIKRSDLEYLFMQFRKVFGITKKQQKEILS